MTTWKDKLSPEALERKRERDRQRDRQLAKNGRGGFKQISVSIKDKEVFAIWKMIPNKSEWFRQQLDKYAEEHKNDNMER